MLKQVGETHELAVFCCLVHRSPTLEGEVVLGYTTLQRYFNFRDYCKMGILRHIFGLFIEYRKRLDW